MSAAPTTYVVRGSSQRGGTAEIDAGDVAIDVDTAWAAAEPSGHPGPADLLAAALAACLLKNVERAGAMMPFRYERAEVTVHARRQDVPPRFVEFVYELRVTTDEDDRRVELLHRNLSQFGTVYNTLAAVCDVHGTLIAVRE